MAAPKVQTKEDIQISTNQTKLRNVEKEFIQFSTNYQGLKPHERAKTYQKLQRDLAQLQSFISSFSGKPLFNTSTKFSLENLKNSFQSLNSRWKRFVQSLE